MAELRAMTAADVAAVAEIERAVHAHPWTHGNFLDALKAGHVCRVLEEAGTVLGYAVLMLGVDEAELLDIGVAAGWQRRGLGRRLLQEMLEIARAAGRQRVLLEVRASNAAAIALYRAAGFCEIGRRRGYYPAMSGREDALLLGCEL